MGDGMVFVQWVVHGTVYRERSVAGWWADDVVEAGWGLKHKIIREQQHGRWRRSRVQV